MDETARSLWTTCAGGTRSGAVGRSGLLVGRYALVDLLGAGGGGEVYEARDLLAERIVAIKLVPANAPSEVARARRELAALRWLALPGVIRILDDGVVGGHWFIVMERSNGRPFPGSASPLPWPALAPLVRRLLEILEAVHQAGVVHRDLKPGNVLVEPSGQLTLLDFGISLGAAVGVNRVQRRELTPRYGAPEQAQGGPGDPRSDLFAVGRMVAESLAAPWPREVAAALDSLLAPRPADRPPDAAAAARLLFGEGLASPEPAIAIGQLNGSASLLPLFEGPERLHHLQSDAAALLWATAGADPAAIVRTLGAWTRSGDARRVGDRWALPRAAIARLELQRDPSTRQVVAAVVEGGAGLRWLCLQAQGLAEEGRAERALALAEVGVWAAWEAGDANGEQELLELWARLAMAAEAPGPIDRALYQLDRAPVPTLVHERLGTLLHAWKATLAGEFDRAHGLATGLGPMADPELEIWRQATRVAAARRAGIPAEEALLGELEGWAAQDPDREAKRLGWLGNLRYRQGLFQEAADLHLASAARKRAADARLSARVNAAAALLDAARHQEAATLALACRQEAKRLRHPLYEGRATWTERAAAYRSGRWPAPDPELLEAAALLGPFLHANLGLLEAASAWRQGRCPAAVAAAETAARGFRQVGFEGLEAVAWALAAAAGGAPDPDLWGRAAALAPDFRIQALGLLASVRPLSRSVRLAAHEAASLLDSTTFDIVLDVVSVKEALAWIGPVQPLFPPEQQMSDATQQEPGTPDHSPTERLQPVSSPFPPWDVSTPQGDWGTSNIVELAGGQVLAEVWTEGPRNPDGTPNVISTPQPGIQWVERWVYRSATPPPLEQSLRWEMPDAFDPDDDGEYGHFYNDAVKQRLAQEAAQEGRPNDLLAELHFEYFAPPASPGIVMGASPLEQAEVIRWAAFELSAGMAAGVWTPTGRLLRQLRIVGGIEHRSEYWLLFDNFLLLRPFEPFLITALEFAAGAPPAPWDLPSWVMNRSVPSAPAGTPPLRIPTQVARFVQAASSFAPLPAAP